MLGLFNAYETNNVYAHAKSFSDPATGYTAQLIIHGQTIFIKPEQLGHLSAWYWPNISMYVLVAFAVVIQIWRKRLNAKIDL